MSDQKSAWNWIAGTVATVVFGLLLEVRLRAVSAALKWGFGWVGGVWRWLADSHAVPGWILLLLVTSVAILVLILGVSFLIATPEQPIKRFDHLALDGIRWEWRWFGTHSISDPTAHCINCRQILALNASDRGLREREVESHTEFSCENCGPRATVPLAGELQAIQQRVRRHVGRMVVTGEWEQAIHDEPWEYRRSGQAGRTITPFDMRSAIMD